MSDINRENISPHFSKNETGVLQNLKTFKVVAMCVSGFGVLGILTGIYCYIYRPMSSSEAAIVSVLIFNSIGFAALGYYFYVMTKIVEKLKKD